MGFNSTNTPQPNDQLSVSQGDINNNFNYGFNTINKDHQFGVGRNSSTLGEGRHIGVGYIDSGVQAFPAGDNVNTYVYAHGGDLFLRNVSGLGPVQMTNGAVGMPVAALSGYTYLPGGLMLQWANVVISSGTITGWTLPFASALCASVSITGTNTGYNVTLPLLQNNQWQARIFLNGVEQAGNFRVFVWAIGSK